MAGKNHDDIILTKTNELKLLQLMSVISLNFINFIDIHTREMVCCYSIPIMIVNWISHTQTKSYHHADSKVKFWEESLFEVLMLVMYDFMSWYHSKTVSMCFTPLKSDINNMIVLNEDAPTCWLSVRHDLYTQTHADIFIVSNTWKHKNNYV